ncbi:MAG: FAD-dependent oxidoreductase [Clostridiales bacterium]|jgi:formate dehydrogenase major subunit|nr:FAD-dependent oxidoreductase [Clostridiales bacterium]
MISFFIDDKPITCEPKKTILQAAMENGIFIPNLCYDKRLKPHGACGLCVVENTNSPRLIRACGMEAAEGMNIKTDSPRIRNARKTALELLLSDHRGDCVAPCQLACPAHTDCQGYVGLIANGQYKEALELIKEKIPLPACIGRVCPHPCEEKCRRALVEKPISICGLKRFAADVSETDCIPEILLKSESDTGRRVAVIGGGPAGLSAAYYLRLMGHEPTIFDAMDKMGGMLRYGIPEYRLPKAVLDKEIESIRNMGVKMINNVRIGGEYNFEMVRNGFDAVLVAVGAWKSMAMGCPGEDLSNVLGGIDFLRNAYIRRNLGENVPNYKRVAVCGGGNTAMDACRTAVRLGAEQVYIIYRRTREEMPAEDLEIEEAAEEGVIFKYLTNPLEFRGEDGAVRSIHLQKMCLGKPDASGRRSPVPIEGETETLDVDAVIVAIGQKLDNTGLESLALTRRNNIQANEETFATNIPGVFAIGDAINKGAGIAIEAIAHAKFAAESINCWLKNEVYQPVKQFYSKEEKTEADFKSTLRIPREEPEVLPPRARCVGFSEVSKTLTRDQAVNEAKRCLECGCADYFECKLASYSTLYGARAETYQGQANDREIDQSSPYFYRDPDKCILCGLCARVCDEVVGVSALWQRDRGFVTQIKPEFDLLMGDSRCISCGACLAVCPTGALCELSPTLKKPVPLKEKFSESVCTLCDQKCKILIGIGGGMQTRVLPGGEDVNLCAKGRFGLGQSEELIESLPGLPDWLRK